MNLTRIAKSIADDCIGFRVRKLNRIVSRVYDDALRPHGIRFSQMNVLTVVLLRGPIQPVEVGRILSLEKSTLSRNLRVMETNGWIVSEPAESGGGQVLKIAPRGEKLYQAVAPAWRKAQRQITALLGDEGTSAIRDAVDQVQESS